MNYSLSCSLLVLSRPWVGCTVPGDIGCGEADNDTKTTMEIIGLHVPRWPG